MNIETTKTNSHKGLVVAELIDWVARKTKNDETFYILEISTRRTITEMVLELRRETNPISINGKETLFVFANDRDNPKNWFAFRLEKGCIYAFWFVKSRNGENQEDYFHVKNWKKLSSDKRSVERTLGLVLNKKEEVEEEEVMTNQELLTELKERLKNKKITFQLSAENTEANVLDIDTDLKDNESNFRINLQDKGED